MSGGGTKIPAEVVLTRRDVVAASIGGAVCGRTQWRTGRSNGECGGGWRANLQVLKMAAWKTETSTAGEKGRKPWGKSSEKVVQWGETMARAATW